MDYRAKAIQGFACNCSVFTAKPQKTPSEREEALRFLGDLRAFAANILEV
jgi:hypothetical protein